jgi:Apea-like HEPN
MITEVTVALRKTVENIIHLATASGLSRVPSDEFTYSWWERKTPQGKELLSAKKTRMSLYNLFSVVATGHGPPFLKELQGATIAFERSRDLMSGFLTSAEKLLHHYFVVETLGALTLDEGALQRTINGYVTALTPPFELVTTLLWTGMTAPEPFSVTDTIRFRPIAPADYEELGRDYPSIPAGVVGRAPYPSSDDWIAEIRQSLHSQVQAVPLEIMTRLVVGLGLVVSGKAQVYPVGTEFGSPFLKCGRLSHLMAMSTSRRGTDVLLSAHNIEEFRDIYARLEDVDSNPVLGYLGVPLRRFHASSARPTDEDGLVDFVIGLESLLAPDSPNIEVTFRFRLRGATVLGSDFGNAMQRLTFLSKLYSARSAAVHGKKIKNIRDLCVQAESALKAVFKWYLFRGDAAEGAMAIVRKIDIAMASASVEPGPAPPS